MKIKIWLSPNFDGYRGKNKGVAHYNSSTNKLHGTAARTDTTFVEAELDTNEWSVEADTRGGLTATKK